MTGDSTVREARFHTSESKVRRNSVELFPEAPRSRDYQGTGRAMSGVDGLVPPNNVGGTGKNSEKLIMG